MKTFGRRLLLNQVWKIIDYEMDWKAARPDLRDPILAFRWRSFGAADKTICWSRIGAPNVLGMSRSRKEDSSFHKSRRAQLQLDRQ